MIIEIKCCPRCESPNIRKNGKDYKGAQKYHCRDCNSYGTLDPKGKGYTEEFKDMVIRAYGEQKSMRGIQRLFGVHRSTLTRWLRERENRSSDVAKT